MIHSAVAPVNQLMNEFPAISVPVEEEEAVINIHQLLKQKKTDDAFQLMTPGGAITIPNSLFTIWEQAAQVMADSVRQYLTVEEAANILDIPSVYMIELLNDGFVPFSKIEAEPRIHMRDVLSYQRKRDSDRKVALHELTRLSQLFGGYEELR